MLIGWTRWGAKLRYLIGILLEPRASFMDMQFLYSGLGPGLTGALCLVYCSVLTS